MIIYPGDKRYSARHKAENAPIAANHLAYMAIRQELLPVTLNNYIFERILFVVNLYMGHKNRVGGFHLPGRYKCSIFFRMDEHINRLSQRLFWDVDQNTVDIKKHERWLVERVLQRGSWEDWLVIRQAYGKKELKNISTTLRLDPKSANFLKIFCSS